MAMRKDEISDICSQNKAIAKAYADFREKHPYAKILDMWEQAHFVKPIYEVYIKYLVGGWQEETYRYYAEY